mmetsp:Transcript_27127/g.56827  ORF Transcript_27127/g.56827 Transcript_27127/m.56827 type:complete len:317 (-) Transcript_27127:1540-2490(-)
MHSRLLTRLTLNPNHPPKSKHYHLWHPHTRLSQKLVLVLLLFLASPSKAFVRFQPRNGFPSIAYTMSSTTPPDPQEEESTLVPDDSSNKELPRIDRIEPVATTKWLALETYHYTDQRGKERKWDVATRTTKPTQSDMDKTVSTPGNTISNADAVVIIPLLQQPHTNSSSTKNNEVETLLVEQYRPPLQQTTMEFPAGLVDAGETVEQAALRELREETGYVGEFCSTVPQVTRAVCMSPGMCTETVHICLVHVDLENPYNHGVPTPELDDGEYVTVHRVSLNEGLQTLLDTCPSMPIMGLYLFAMGFQLGRASSNEK